MKFKNVQELATPEAFSRNPSRVWEFYHYRREVMLTKNPNPAHLAIAECEERLRKQGRKVTVITQNIDELHRRAGSKNILEIHGEQKSDETMCQQFKSGVNIVIIDLLFSVQCLSSHNMTFCCITFDI